MCHELVVVAGIDGSSAGDAALRHALSRAQTYGRERCIALSQRPVVVVPDRRGGEPDWGRDAVA
jgi:hypothetical protein